MCSPRQRGAYESQKCGYNLPNPENPITDYCAHCLNGGTVSATKSNLASVGWKPYNPLRRVKGTAKRAGLCGDAIGRTDHMIGGDFMPYPEVPITAVYKEGDEIDLSVEIDTNHNGFFEFYLCDLDACRTPDIHVQCFRKKTCYKLLRVPHADCEDSSKETTYECGPIDEKYPSRWYVPCRNTGHVGVHIVGGPAGTMRYRLPVGVTCKHCVMQWYWATANSCNPPGLRSYILRKKRPFGTTCESDGGGLGAFSDGLPNCEGLRVPEEFWSCADVQVTTDGGSGGVVPARGLRLPRVKPEDTKMLTDDLEAAIESGQEAMEEDMLKAVQEGLRDAQESGTVGAESSCFRSEAVCDTSVPCCEAEQVCVYTPRVGTLSCRFWWALWRDAHDQRKLHTT